VRKRRTSEVIDGDAQIGKLLGEAEERGKIGGAHGEIEGEAAARQFRRGGGNAIGERGAEAAEARVRLAFLESRAVAHDQAGDVRPGCGKWESIYHQDGAVESIAREDGLQVLRRMVG
jgi:hypothetical protein